MTHPLRTVVVGLNHYHVTGWVESLAAFESELEIIARFDPDPARAALSQPDFSDPNLPQGFPDWFASVPFYSDLEEMIAATSPELALVTLPNVDVPDAATLLSTSGTHLLIDKPGGADAQSAARAVAAARNAGVRMAIAFTRRHGHPWQQAARQIAAGRLGRILTVESVFTTSSVDVRDARNLIFRRDLMGGGILSWLGVHDIDLIHWLTGEEIALVQAMSQTRSTAGIDVEDAISIAFRLSGGALGTMHFAYALPRSGGDGYIALRGTNASVRIDATGDTVWTGPGSPGDPLLTERSSTESIRLPGYGSAGHQIIADLLQSIRENRDPVATGDHAVAALRVIDAAYASASSGQRVAIGSMPS
ncbi:MAG: Gfo/Idh/MocA family protein [Thermomicrobiales bacterium]